MDRPLISAKNISLSVPVFQANSFGFRGSFFKIISGAYANHSRREERQLLKNINFELMAGQKLGIIGKNGAGKTTLLRVLCGIYQQSSGDLEIHGKIHGLFSVSLGMNNRATGIENVYLRGLQMGLSIKMIRELLPGVIEFADIGDSINDTFDTYSAGMRLRLSTAISTMIKPEILIMDEWIGAGDDEFKKKLRERMHEIVDGSKGLVIATHSRGLMKRLCTHGIVLRNGESPFFGEINDAFEYYDSTLS